mgnify:CR=1 FL=1
MDNIIKAQKNVLPDLGRLSPSQIAQNAQAERDNITRGDLVQLNNKFEAQIKSINETILSLAVHIQELTPTPVAEEQRWKPKKSDMLLWDKDKESISWENRYKGSRIFLVCGGPSLNDVDLSLMNKRGVMSMAINNAWSRVKPDFWIGFDSPGRFSYYGWMDPSIIKFVPWQNKEQNLNSRVGGKISDTGHSTMKAPNCWYLSNNEKFDPKTWFSEASVNWGGPVKGVIPENGFRVTLLGALRMLYYLGFQEVYLLGCDWEMALEGEAYAWEEDKTLEKRKSNNEMYDWTSKVLGQLDEGFKKSGFQIFNCNPHSKLDLYPHISYEEAISRSTIPDINDTRGWYETDSSNYPKDKV